MYASVTTLTVDREAPISQRKRLLAALVPLSAGQGEIYALDGLRAIAALSVVFFHSYYSVTRSVVIAGQNITFLWNYGQSGVHLFFVLSGFLLFMPFARAMLNAKSLPSTKRFFQRRALRILPAYWVCLAILAALQFNALDSLTGLLNVGAHVLLIHDDFPIANRTIEGPFWTLAVEAQFYVVLPVFAWAISRFVGATRSPRRVIAGVLGVIAGALVLRALDAVVQGRLESVHGIVGQLATVFVTVTLGIQGKYLEVFGLGMLCSVLYLVVQERRESLRWLGWAGAGLAVCALAGTVGFAQLEMHRDILTPPFFLFVHATDPMVIAGPLMAGMPYAALTLSALWGPAWLRAVFEFKPLRFIGLISYSLYLWHEPILVYASRYALLLPAGLRIGFELLIAFTVAVPVAYLSYQFVERPFLARRRLFAAAPSSADVATP